MRAWGRQVICNCNRAISRTRCIAIAGKPARRTHGGRRASRKRPPRRNTTKSRRALCGRQARPCWTSERRGLWRCEPRASAVFGSLWCHTVRAATSRALVVGRCVHVHHGPCNGAGCRSELHAAAAQLHGFWHVASGVARHRARRRSHAGGGPPRRWLHRAPGRPRRRPLRRRPRRPPCRRRYCRGRPCPCPPPLQIRHELVLLIQGYRDPRTPCARLG